LTRRAPFVKSVFLNVNPHPGNVVLGPDWRRLAGSPFLEESLAGLRFRLSPGTFFQFNHAQAEKLYAQAVEFAAPDPGDNVLELYAGVGAMGMMLAAKAARVWAIEENRQAVRDGIESAGLNGATNIRFVTALCEEALARRHPRQEIEGTPLVALLDPPRAGCDPRVLKSVMRLAPKRIVYVSCDPGTLARDARLMATGGYKLAASVPVDLFPQTAHIESVSLFRKDQKSPTREVT
jgi:23S rRNA (uracil1939-C5)-methyltransferase